MTHTARPDTHARGHALLSVLVLTAVLLLTGTASLQLTRGELHRTAQQAAQKEALYVAEAGVQHGLTRLHQDRLTAHASTTYTASDSGTIDGRPYAFAIDQDPNDESDPRRKRIRATGVVNGMTAEVLAHAVVQPARRTGSDPTAPPDTCDGLLGSHTGKARLFGVAATSAGGIADPVITRHLFDGDIYTNPGHDVEFTIHANLVAEAGGTVTAGRDFVSNAALALLSELDAQLLVGGAYRSGPLEAAHTHALPPLPAPQGIHFNGQNDASTGHGQLQTPAAWRPFPRPDYRSLAHSPRTLLVNAESVGNGSVPGSWADGTWELSSPLIFGSFALDPNVVYYVDGNAKIDTLLLAAEANATIVARGWIAIENLGLLTSGPLCTSAQRMAGPALAGASLCTQVGPTTHQRLHVLAEKDLVIGHETIGVAMNAAEEGLVVAGTVTAGTGIGTAVANTGGRTEILGYSETSEVWALVSLVSAGADTRLNLCAKRDATLAFAASVADEVTTYRP